MEPIASALLYLNLSITELAFCCAVAFLAGCVRGFAGFGLSAVAMACLVMILPPVELIPVLYILESSASMIMFRSGFREAKMNHVWPLVIGSAMGVPLGLLATTSAPLELSKLVAVCLILILTVLQFSRRMPAALATTPGRFATGATAGIATGLASVGGMVVALYVLASRTQPKQMRATLTMFLFIGMFTSFFYLTFYGVLTQTAIMRGAVLVPLTLAGVLLGTFAFKPALQKFYRLFCLVLLVAICVVSLTRILIE